MNCIISYRKNRMRTKQYLWTVPYSLEITYINILFLSMPKVPEMYFPTI